LRPAAPSLVAEPAAAFAPEEIMRLHSRIAALVVSALAFAAHGALPPILADSAALDRSYIPALMLTNAKDPAKARSAHDAYEKAWAAFATRHRAATTGDAGWQKVFDAIDEANAAARAAIAAGKMGEVHNAQEEVRHLLWQQRQATGLAYQPDVLTDFHATMELIVASVQGKKPVAIGAADITILRPQLVEARRLWTAVKSARWDPTDYGLDGARLESYRAALVAEDKALDELGAALDASDGTRIANAAAAIKPPFAKAYGSFGVFPD